MFINMHATDNQKSNFHKKKIYSLQILTGRNKNCDKLLLMLIANARSRILDALIFASVHFAGDVTRESAIFGKEN